MSKHAAPGHPGHAAPLSRGDRGFDGDRRLGAHHGGGAAASDPDTSHLLDAVLRENEALQVKMARVSRAIHGLVTDLAASRRECRHKQLEIDSLRVENAALTAAAPARGEESVLEVRRLGAAGGVEGPEQSTLSRSPSARATDGPASAEGIDHLATGRFREEARL